MVIPSSIDESGFSHLPPEDYVKTLAESKATDISKKYPESWVIGADTIVLSNGHVLEKPKDKDDARGMLHQLSGAAHDVFTGYCACCEKESECITGTVKTTVYFKPLSDEEIEWYIDTDEPFDKAGAYAIQGLGTFLVQRINGSYTNVVGLPVCELIEILIKKKVIRLQGRV